MGREEYEKARKLGERELHAREAAGESPYLPVLDEILEHVNIDSRVSLGLAEIPLDQVAGTVTLSRTRSFAANFMPILDENTEFAYKWETLYDQLETQGQRDPVTAVEYLNKFYIVEGNKRVSVLKYMDAVCVEGTVTRYIPRLTADKEILIYYEFLRFYRDSNVNYVTMSEMGNYSHLVRLMGVQRGERWDSRQRQDFKVIYQKFMKEYNALGGAKLRITAGDAFVTYLRFFNYRDSYAISPAEMRKNLQKIWEEFTTNANEESTALLMQPTFGPSRSILSSVFRPVRSHIKAGFVYNRPIEGSGWCYSHELGRQYVEEAMGDRVETVMRENVRYDEAEQVLEQLVDEGCNTIFTTSPIFGDIVVKMAVAHPEVDFLSCSLMPTARQVRSYYLRMYEAKFIVGAVAGALAENDRIGYVADYPIYGTIASINAFALGAKMINRKAQIYLEWSTLKDHDFEETFRKNGVGIISNRDLSSPDSRSRDFGLYYIDEQGETVNLAMPVWNWGKLYAALLGSMLDGTWKKDASNNSNQTLNYWWGMSTDSIDVFCSRRLPAGTHRLVDLLRGAIQSNQFRPMAGRMVDQAGNVHNADYQDLSPAEILAMDWLDESIIGFIPKAEDMRDDCRHIVHMQGVANTPTPDTSSFTWTGIEAEE